MNLFEVYYDESFLTSWRGDQSDIDLGRVASFGERTGQNLRNVEVILTTSSQLKKYEGFSGLIFCYQDELLDITEHFEQTDKVFSIPSSLSDKDIENFVDKKITTWLKAETEKVYSDSVKNFKFLKRVVKNNQEALKDNEVRNIQKIEQTIKRKLLRPGTLPVLNRKLKYSILDEKELVKPRKSIDFIFGSSLSQYHVLSIFDDRKWLERNSKFILILLDIIASEVNQEERDSFLISVLESIPYPLVVISDMKEVCFSNKEFLSLNLSVNQVLKSSSTIRIGNYLYQVKMRSFIHEGDKLNSYFFINQGLDTNEINLYNDLGIICSSLAHELKNPLAGVLAALNVLEITDTLDDEAYDYLDKMKDTTLRAKKLVETFLGFSKFKIPNQEEKNLCVFSESAFQQASQLIKERIVETQTDMQFNYLMSSHFKHRFNESILLMTFYLLFNENLTHYQHNKLVKPIEKSLVISCTEYHDGLKVQISPFVCPLENHKLIKHLLTMQGLRIESESDFYWIRSVS